MFETLTERMGQVFTYLKGATRLDEDNIKAALQEVRTALLEADVALPVITRFTQSVREKALGQAVTAGLSPQQFFIKLVNECLIALMGEANVPINLKGEPPVVILMAGLQGSGKTTSSAKLAKYLQETLKKKVMLSSVDIYRPAAIDQLEILSKEVEASFFRAQHATPVEMAKEALTAAQRQYKDILILDTAGRLHIDEEMMWEIKALHAAVKPLETFFVVDAMTGQDAANTAKVFHDALPLTGVILTKMDGDARGGAALSVREITGKPIKFIGVGEKVAALEPFHPERMASRILGMGDVLTLIEELERKVDKEKAEKLAQKLKAGKAFNLNDLREQLRQMLNMGGMAMLLDKLPGMHQLPAGIKEKANDKEVKKMLAIIDSMTKKERKYPTLINGSRKKRIAMGSGTQIQDVNRLLKQHEKMAQMMKKMSQPGMMKNLMRGMEGMKGMMPPNMRF